MGIVEFIEARRNDIILVLVAGIPWVAYSFGQTNLFGLELRKDVLWLITIFSAVIYLILNWEERRRISKKRTIWEIEASVREQMTEGDVNGVPLGFPLGEFEAAARERDVPEPRYRVLFPQADGSGRACYVETDPRGGIDFVRKGEDLPSFKDKYFEPTTLQRVRSKWLASRFFDKNKKLEKKLEQIRGVLPSKELKMLEEMEKAVGDDG